jgi:hypothetical protein
MAIVDGILMAAWRWALRLSDRCGCLHIVESTCKRVVLAIVPLVFATALASCQPNASEGIKFGWFYRMVVDLSYGDEPLNIEVIIGCGSQERQILGEGRSVRAIWAPYIYGVRTKNGEGVLVQSPNICDRDLAKQPMPADFLPVVFWAPDAGNLEFMVAYLHEQAYAQPVSKLKFHKATFTEATKGDYETWRQAKWKDNIVPLGDRGDEYSNGSDFFRGGGFFPKGDPRNAVILRLSCHAMLRVPIAGVVQDKIRERWPADKPRFWLIDWSTILALRNQYPDQLGGTIRLNPQWNREMPGALPSFYAGKGVNRPSGTGHIELIPNKVASGQGLRIPYRVETGYPWASDRLFSQTTLDINIDTANGADHGFAYCFRDMWMHYLARSGPGGQIRPVNQRFFIDGQLVATLPDANTVAPSAAIVEHDQYLWLKDFFPLTHELSRMQ